MSSSRNGVPHVTSSRRSGAATGSTSSGKTKNSKFASSVSKSDTKSPTRGKKSPRKHTTKKKNSSSKSSTSKKSVALSPSKNESSEKLWQTISRRTVDVSGGDMTQEPSEELIRAGVTLDPDVLRWENTCEDEQDELNRIEVYKTNRRLRYINARNTQLALLAIKEQK